MDKKITSIGAILFASGIFVWILNYTIGLGWHYGGEAIYTADMALSVSLPFFGLIFIYLGITPNPPDITEDSPS
jgi:cephalosporin hydroxylase